MTHAEIMKRLETVFIFTDGYYQSVVLCKKTLEDYISMAMANEVVADEIIAMVLNNSKIKESEIVNAINKYMDERMTRGRAVMVKGVRYSSIQNAADTLGRHRNSIEDLLKRGAAKYV